ncbi:MAG TPA: CoA-transferase [Chloroflexia bacterium]|nr:CoA-transferase [Chloroflexia bacterium]
MADDYKPVLRAGSDPLVFFKYPGAGTGGDVAKGHVMAAAMSRMLGDGEVVVMGTNSMIPLAAARLAQLTHAPNLTTLVGASGGINTLVEPLAPSSGDYANIIAEAVLEFDEVMMLQMGGKTDVFFAGGIQIDRHGNCNLAAVGELSKPQLRGPGSAGLPWAQKSGRTIIYTTTHDKRTFVPEVDFVSLRGGDKGAFVVSPLCVMQTAPGGSMRLVSTHGGVTVDDIVANTGFELSIPQGGVPSTADPTPDEFAHLRELDPDGLLAIVV